MVPKKEIIFIAVTIVTMIEISGGVRIKPGRWQYCYHSTHSGRSGGSLCPNQWVGKCKSGRNQSPINIVTKDLVKAKINEPFSFTTNRKFFPRLSVKNNGHTVKVIPRGNASDYYTMDKVIYEEIY